MTRVYTILLLVHLALIVVALVDCLSADETAIRGLPGGTWVFLILLTAPLGPIAWFVLGQPIPVIRLADGRVLRADRGRFEAAVPLSARPARPVPVFAGPEDDPDFVASLAQDLERRRAQES
jgi:hypothetical protein